MGNRLWLAPHFFVVCLNILCSGVFMVLWFYFVFQYVPGAYCGEI